MSRLAHTFQTLKAQNKKALIPYITAGDPHPNMTVAIMHTLVEHGANVIELGVPFSDPMADGPVIQRANERALLHGVSLSQVLTMVATFRQTDTQTPIVIMGYTNPIEAMGIRVFASAAKQAGVDGLITVDYPPDEDDDYLQILLENSLSPIFLLSPTTSLSRSRLILRCTRDFVYYVSLKGVTGAGNLDVATVAKHIETLRTLSQLPIGVGFGISSAQQAHAMAQVADAIIVGSYLVQTIEHAEAGHALKVAAQLIAELRHAIDATP